MDKWDKARENALRRNAEDLRLILAEEKATTQLEKDIIHLKII